MRKTRYRHPWRLFSRSGIDDVLLPTYEKSGDQVKFERVSSSRPVRGELTPAGMDGARFWRRAGLLGVSALDENDAAAMLHLRHHR
jgi:hypothetical protein